MDSKDIHTITAQRAATPTGRLLQAGQRKAEGDFDAVFQKTGEHAEHTSQAARNEALLAAREAKRQARVEELKLQVQSGQYEPNLREVAHNILFNDNGDPML